MNSSSTQHVSRNRLLVVGIFVAVIAVITNVIFALSALQEPAVVIPSPTSVPPSTRISVTSKPLKYGFDEGSMGWVPGLQAENQAVVDVRPQIKFGESTLELSIELIGKDDAKSKGEVFVDLSSNPPFGAVAPIDLEGKTITMLVYVPSAVIGTPNSPNGIQVFVTDNIGRSQYGEWLDLTTNNTDRWTTITLLPSTKITNSATEEPSGAFTNVGFDPSKINIVGLKIGTGNALENVFIGSIWIDWVDWR